ncbi:hypothetical protein ACIGDI_35985 [Streptomyces sp. NPDC085900]|uniref:hypothetical protein n=1 Tax=Streptomyces sp. NPDC085900 TaxID=3365737 RepID=UPI0037D459A1
MAARRQEPQQGVSTVSYTIGTGNTTVAAAAGDTVDQDVTVAGTSPAPTKLDEAKTLLDELRTVLKDHAEELEDSAQCDAAVAMIGQQLDSGRPQQSLLGVFLSGLLAAIGGATDVIAIAEKLRDAIQALFP